MREGKDQDIEETLNQWFAIVTGRRVRLSVPMLKSKPEKLAKNLGHSDFKAPYGSLSR
jgi:hypothetical protein